MRKTRRITALIICFLFLVGCRDIGRESSPNERSFVSAVGIDRDGEEWVLTLETASSGEQEGKTLKGRGKALNLAMSNIITSGSKELLFTHCRAIVLGSSVQKEWLEKGLSFCADGLSLPLSVRLISTESAEKLLSADAVGSGYSISDIADNTADRFGFGAHATLYEIQTARIRQTSLFALPYFELSDNLHLSGLAVYKSDEFTSHLNLYESVAYAVLRNVFEGGTVFYGEESENITSTKSKISGRLSDGVLKIRITICTSPESEIITRLVRDALTAHSTDLFGIEDSLKSQDPELCGTIDDFEEHYKNAIITVEVE